MDYPDFITQLANQLSASVCACVLLFVCVCVW